MAYGTADDEVMSGAGSDSGSNGMSSQSTQKRLPKRPFSAAQALSAVPPVIANALKVPSDSSAQPPADMAPFIGPAAVGQTKYSDSSKGTPADSAQDESTSEAPDMSYGDSSTPDPGSVQGGTTMPSLAPQGSRNPFVRALQKYAGAIGKQPTPGQTYTGPQGTPAPGTFAGPDTRSPLVAGASNILSRVGNYANQEQGQYGTQFDREMMLERQKIGAQHQLALAQLASLEDWRQTQGGIKQQQVDINQQKNDLVQQKNDSSMRLKGYVRDENGNGYRAMNAEEILSDPLLSSNQDLKMASIATKNASASLAKAHADAIMNPNNQVFQQTERRIQAQLAMANAHLSVQREKLAQSGIQAMWQYGQNPQTGEQLGPNNAPPGMLTDPTGQPVPFRSMSNFSPTSQMKNVAAQAQLASSGIPGVLQEIDELKDQMGPVAGRWNEFMQGKVGTDNPAFAGLRADLMMVSTAVALAHARGRLPENLRQEFDTMINAPQQDPENVKAVLNHILPWMKNAANMASQGVSAPPTVAPRNASGGTTTPIHRAAQPNGGGTVRMQAPDGTIQPVPADQVQHYKSLGAKVLQ